ncbi:cell division protein FtsL [Marinovum sp. 2_MG-2023]|uniref:cell division protein FtsL n=1 Tax=Roseobacteraceae TaxID=2854170 RepID=UPI001FD5E583|nr:MULTISPECIES: cell division protein FtsL [Roseobacteraceae]MCJ7872521.1 cell division protein FtsL [Phaeobacter sp. J2-8]MDO6731383.1 cell division protein FtsL [Marinovum sp. 2_MG-2023]MDO6780718.1 cell division protein FtsL [Marinovum sp. 1_MG-2023]
MRSFLYILTSLAVIGLAFWAYHENYRTQEAIEKSAQLQRDIGTARSRLSVLRAEWAYLNRPDRLRDLAELNFDRLGLLPLRPHHFANIDQVTFPMPDFDNMEPITNPVAVSSQGEEQEP